MGTRHLIIVKKDKKNKIAQYGQWDGYLSEQGINILRFLNNSENIRKLRKSLSKVRFFDKEKDRGFLDSYNENSRNWSNEPDKRTEVQKMWFNKYISRDLGSDILINVAESQDKEILLRNGSDFADDVSFCEYLYLIDLDENTFSIFTRGFTNKLGEYNLNKLPKETEFLALENMEE